MIANCPKCNSPHISVCIDAGQGRAACLICGEVTLLPADEVRTVQPGQTAPPVANSATPDAPEPATAA